jgi:murein DD-endopeptidase MepM/ murein hydrolase activator NlpD
MRKLTFYILIIIIATASAGWGARRTRNRNTTPRSKAALQQRQQQVKQRMLLARHKLKIVVQRKRQVNQKLTVDTQREQKTRQQLQVATVKHEISYEKLNRAKHQLVISDRKLKRHEKALSTRMEQLYEQGNSGLLEVLLTSSNYTDLQNRAYLTDQVIERDATLLDNYEQAKTERAEAKHAAADAEREVAIQKQQAAMKHSSAAVEKQQTEAQSKEVAREQAILEQQIAALEQDYQRLSAELRRFYRTRAGRASLALHFNGNLIAPVSGRISSRVGMRNHPIYGGRRMHRGTDIAAPSGTPIRAAAAGIVFKAAYGRGYGNHIVIIHGGGTSTLYGHCSRLAVSSGQRVKQGQVIGYVGSTGASTGPHLHFEVRRDGQVVDPLR